MSDSPNEKPRRKEAPGDPAGTGTTAHLPGAEEKIESDDSLEELMDDGKVHGAGAVGGPLGAVTVTRARRGTAQEQEMEYTEPNSPSEMAREAGMPGADRE